MPTTLLLKLIGAGVAVAMIGAFVFSWYSRGRDIEALEAWQHAVTSAVTQATVEPDKKGKREMLAAESVIPAITALKSSLESCASTLDGIDTKSKSEAAVSAALDGRLTDYLKQTGKQFESQRKKIESLANRKSTGDAVADCTAMDADSAAAWNGWRE